MEQYHFILPQIDLKSIAVIRAAALLAAWVIPFFVDKYGLRGYPGPLLAEFSGFWLASQAYKGTTTSAVHALHQKYGLNFGAFDVIGDLAFGAPFGMLEAEKDTVPVPVSEEQAMKSYGQKDMDLEWSTLPAIKLLNETIPRTSFLGCLPPQGKPLSEQDLTSEALNLIVAGSDTTSRSFDWCYRLPCCAESGCPKRLQKELDDVLRVPNSTFNTDEVVASFDRVKNVAYLQDAINEGLRLHSTVGVGLPREVPQGGLTIAGKALLPGTHVSCPSYTLHRLKSIWGDDADEFNPDRWTRRGDRNAILKYLAPFSIGPRACIGRNLVMMEMTICVATISHPYRLVLANPDQQLECSEGFVRKPKNVHVGSMQRRL
ncbi:uncharacterized protein PHACADRAFT_212558 [Phanerochaete carnosa HHB-10118-sp]|uniref:Cytochrome P450 monooxygenase n=1 Tax=Phanerochaete carnosa (strain HHB-10118-sp) TaxID=650164 RepID=K5VZB0_PHACS|nr:uncharacterized protein PHACADRAFT_212558 [Phanerochaete carnosa HHB-10118-sp]EKM51944.1 hypothetical protein PHACADRAFT_212558 [Phanerochaete carnosa HHB-10118-sp]